jgi:hypothetical protein
VWGFFDPSGIFWLSGELYERGKPLSDYFARLPASCTCDPSGNNERLELKKAGFNVREGINAKVFGINLVTRWLRSGRLKTVRSVPTCAAKRRDTTTPAPATVACVGVSDRSAQQHCQNWNGKGAMGLRFKSRCPDLKCKQLATFICGELLLFG